MLQEMIESGKTTFKEVETAMQNMKKRITELEQIHQLDQDEIIRLRRWIERLEEQT